MRRTMVRIRYRHFQWLRVVTCGTLFACGGGGGGGGTEPPPSDAIKAEKSSGDNQSGTVARPLPAPLVIIATQNGTGAAGVAVTWATVSPTAGSVSPTSTTTDAD